MSSRTCRICGRYLPSLRSQRLGFGPKCLKRYRDSVRAQAEVKLSRVPWDYSQQQYDKALRALREHRYVATRPRVYRIYSESGEVYLTHRETCTCPSGRYRPTSGTCWHTLLVRMLVAMRITGTRVKSSFVSSQ